jgi:hypothetical protein
MKVLMVDMVDRHYDFLTELCAAWTARRRERSVHLIAISSTHGGCHRPEVMFGVLVVILCPDRIADESFGTGERQIPLVVSLRVLRVFRLGAYVARFPRLGADSK